MFTLMIIRDVHNSVSNFLLLQLYIVFTVFISLIETTSCDDNN